MKGQMNLFSGFGEEVCISIADVYGMKKEDMKETSYICTKEHLQELFQKARIIIENEAFPIEGTIKDACYVNESMSSWGRCKHHTVNGENIYTISVSPKLLETTEKSVMQTLLHEFLHATKGCMNHGTTWKNRAALINAKYGYNIQTRSNAKELGIKEENMEEFYRKNYKYVIRCKNCGQMIGYKKMTKVIKYPEWYLCGYCQGKFERIQ